MYFLQHFFSYVYKIKILKGFKNQQIIYDGYIIFRLELDLIKRQENVFVCFYFVKFTTSGVVYQNNHRWVFSFLFDSFLFNIKSLFFELIVMFNID